MFLVLNFKRWIRGQLVRSYAGCFLFVLEWAAQALPGHRCPEMYQFAVHSALPGGSWWSGHWCSFLEAVASDQIPKAVPRPWEPAADIPPPEHLPSVSTAAAAEWEHCSSNACSCTTTVQCPPAPQDSLRTCEDKKTEERNYINMRRERKKLLQGEQKERMLDVGSCSHRYACWRKGQRKGHVSTP